MDKGDRKKRRRGKVISFREVAEDVGRAAGQERNGRRRKKKEMKLVREGVIC